eukprot:1510005-Rhodomonas_salina.3
MWGNTCLDPVHLFSWAHVSIEYTFLLDRATCCPTSSTYRERGLTHRRAGQVCGYPSGEGATCQTKYCGFVEAIEGTCTTGRAAGCCLAPLDVIVDVSCCTAGCQGYVRRCTAGCHRGYTALQNVEGIGGNARGRELTKGCTGVGGRGAGRGTSGSTPQLLNEYIALP